MANVRKAHRQDIQIRCSTISSGGGRDDHRVLGHGEIPIHPEVGLHQRDRVIHDIPLVSQSQRRAIHPTDSARTPVQGR
jgi:hypothetical protein